MTITKFGNGCDCDCCETFNTKFCEQLVFEGNSIGYLNPTFWDDEAGGGNSWTISTTDGGCFALSCPDENKPFAHGVTSANFAGRRALFKPTLLNEWHGYFDIELFYKSSLPTGNYNIGFEVAVDYQDDDNFHAVRVKFDYAHVTGYALVYEFLRYEAGAETVLHTTYSTIPSGVASWRPNLHVALVNCDNGDRMLYAGTSSGTQSTLVGLVKIDSYGGNQFAIATAFSQYAGATTFDCDGVEISISEHVRLYGLTLKRHEDDLAGCGKIQTECLCDCWLGDEYDVTISGVANTSDCDSCTDLNDTFTLTRSASLSSFAFCSSMQQCCWSYEKSDYSGITCDVDRIELYRCGTKWGINFMFDYGSQFYETLGWFDGTIADCIDLDNVDLGSIFSGCWHPDGGSFCPSILCDVGSISIALNNA